MEYLAVVSENQITVIPDSDCLGGRQTFNRMEHVDVLITMVTQLIVPTESGRPDSSICMNIKMR